MFNSKAPLKEMTSSEFHHLGGRVCLEAEGKARIEFGREQYVFGYDFVTKDDQWLLAAEIPFKGEEALKVLRTANSFKFSGDFYQKIRSNYHFFRREHPEYPKKGVEEVLRFLTKGKLFFKSHLDLIKEKCKESALECRFEWKGISLGLNSHGVTLSQEIKQKNIFWEILKNDSDDLLREDITLTSDEQTLISLRFFHQQCQFGPSK
jgi:hypothetical protein